MFEGRDRQTGDLKWTATEFDLVFGSNSELRSVVEFYAFDESRQRFIKDFASAWTKVMDADRFDIEDSGNVVVSVAQVTAPLPESQKSPAHAGLFFSSEFVAATDSVRLTGNVHVECHRCIE